MSTISNNNSDMEENVKFINWHDFIAGWIGGIAGLVVGQPGDTIKVRQQTFNVQLWPTIKKTYGNEGTYGFFRGMLFPLLTTGPTNAIFFGVYGNSLQHLQHTQEKKVQFEDALWQQKVFYAGCIGGIACVLATCPIELVKTILQVNTHGKGHWRDGMAVRDSGMISCTRNIYKQGGIRGLYRGFVPMLYRDVPSYGVFTWVYEVLMYYSFGSQIMGDTLRQILAGGCAGVISWFMIMPFDVVKSRIQADNPQKPTYKGMIDCFYKSYKTDGIVVFGKGTVAVLLRAFPVNAATFVCYEHSLRLLQKHF